MKQGKIPVQISVHEIGSRNIAVQLLDGAFLQPKYTYSVYFKAFKDIEKVDEGLVFKVYRDLMTMKMWVINL